MKELLSKINLKKAIFGFFFGMVFGAIIAFVLGMFGIELSSIWSLIMLASLIVVGYFSKDFIFSKL